MISFAYEDSHLIQMLRPKKVRQNICLFGTTAGHLELSKKQENLRQDGGVDGRKDAAERDAKYGLLVSGSALFYDSNLEGW